MSSPYFDFKQFRIRHDRCAMKVGTDGVLLGAWARVEGCHKILDIGSGSGLIAMMVAQRVPDAKVLGLEIDPDAVLQSRENAMASPFAGRVGFILRDVRVYDEENGFDAVLCNPPFYTEDTLPPDAQRANARSNSVLPFRELVASVCRLLSTDGRLHVILPAQAEPEFTNLCMLSGLYQERLCRVKTTTRKVPKRVLSTYLYNKNLQTKYEELVLMENGMRSEAYNLLTADFYLDFPQSS